MNNELEILDKIKGLEIEKQINQNYEQAIKILLNSIYGCLGSNYFHFYNKNNAETITLQGQDVIKYCEVKLNEYFKKQWHLDYELHKKMNILNVNKVESDVWVYTDTDSGFICFSEILKSCVHNYDEIEFIKVIIELKLKDYINEILNVFAQKYNCENYLDFELEYISKNAIWIAKKNYIQNIVWKEDVYFKPLEKISVKGFEMVQSSTPSFCRKKLKDIIKFIFSLKEFDLDIIVKEIKKIEKQFMLANIDDISESVKINTLARVLNSDDKLVFDKGATWNVKAAGYYNYIINNSKFKDKYKLIVPGDKVKSYITENGLNDNFAYLPNEFPIEIAPKINKRKQFKATFLEPLNRIIEANGFNKLDSSLMYTKGLF